MHCTLMHKSIPVMDIEISDISGGIEKKGTVYNPEHLPIGTTIPYGNAKGNVNIKALHEWWKGRSIPASRDGLSDAVGVLGSNTLLLLSKSYGLSLSDQYWVCPADSGMRWEDINFFDNDFSNDIGEVLFGHYDITKKTIDFRSPDNASDGQLRKKWLIADGIRILMKDGNGVFKQQPFNEVVGTIILRRLGIPHVTYTLKRIHDTVYSFCENFITRDTELVTALHLSQSIKQKNSESNYDHFMRCVDEYKIPGSRELAEQMIVFDYLIANEDRHWTNFGFIRDVNTLEWLGMAPIYDNGTSLWCNDIVVGGSVPSKSFTKSHKDNLKLVKDLSWVDPEALYGVKDEIMEIYRLSDTVDENRSSAIAEAVLERFDSIVRRRVETVKTPYGRDLDVVLAFIHDACGSKTGIRVLRRNTGAIEEITPFPNSGRFWNLTISYGKSDSRLCSISDFPICTSHFVKNAGCWIDGEYADGRLRVISLSGACKDVTQESLIHFFCEHGIANAELVGGRLCGKYGRQFDKLTVK